MAGDSSEMDGMSARLRPGSRIAGYVIEERIGVGGMAVVFRARDDALGRTAALKVLTPALAGDAEFRARFERESQAIAGMRSPHILPVYTAGESDGVLFIAAQFVPGGDLAGLLRRTGGPLEPGHVVALIVQIAAALDAAHAAGLIHRDVKPGNVLIDALPDGTEHAYLADFGLSKRPDATPLTDSAAFIGTPDYAAPEQVTGTPPASARTDQYALACVAFRMLSGKVPYEREDAIAVLYAHAQAPVPSLAQRRPGLPAALGAVVAKGMAKDPASRYGSCGEFAAALAAAAAPASPRDAAKAVSGNDGPASTVTVHRPAAAPAPGQASRPRLSESPRPDLRHPATRGIPAAKEPRTGIRVGTALLLTILVAGAVAYLSWPQGPAQPDTRSNPGVRVTTSPSLRSTTAPSLTVPAGPITMPTTGTSAATSTFSIGTDVATSAFSVDGKLLATEELNLFNPTMPDQVVIWNAVTGAYVRTVTVPPGPTLMLQGLAFSPDDKRLIAVTIAQGAYQWDVSNGHGSVITAQVPQSDPRFGSTDMAVSADGTTIAGVDASGDGIDVRSTATGVVIADLADPDHAPIMSAGSGKALDHAVGLSADGQVLSVADTSGNVYIWSVPSRQVTRVIRYGSYTDAVMLSPAGNLVLLAHYTFGGMNTLWSTASGTEVRPAGLRWTSDAGSGPPLFSLDGRVIVNVTGDNTAADFWNATTYTYLGRVALPGGGNSAIHAIGPGGKELVTDDVSGHPYLVSSPY